MTLFTEPPDKSAHPALFTSPRNAPYFHAIKVANRTQTTGTDRSQLGHQLHLDAGHTPDGVFAEWHWDGEHLYVRNDRYGFYPMYYFARSGEICVSPSLPRLLLEGAPVDLDPDAFAVFLRTGYFLGEDTPFRAIRALPPAASLVWHGGELCVAGAVPTLKLQLVGRDEAIDRYVAIFRQAIQRRPAPARPAVLPLSGGRDSRHILLELCKNLQPPDLCVTFEWYPPRRNDDALVATQLSRVLGVEHIVLQQRRSRVGAEMSKNIATNFCLLESVEGIALRDHLNGWARTVYSGAGGDVLSASRLLTRERLALFDSGRFEDLARGVCRTNEHLLERLLSTEAYVAFGLDRALARLVTELKRHADAPNPIGSFQFWNRTRRGTSLGSQGMLSAVPNILFPYLDHDLYDFLSSLPASVYLDGQFHTDAIQRADPTLASVSFASIGTMRVAPATSRQLARALAWHVARHRASRLVRRSFLLPRLLRSLLEGDYERVMHLAPSLVVYLTQLEAVTQQPSATLEHYG